MQIKFRCPCGLVHSADGDLAGRRVRCKECQQVVIVPGLESGPSRRSSPSRVTTDELQPQRRLATEIVEETEEDRRPKRKKKKRAIEEHHKNQGFFSAEHGIMNSGVLGGVAVMVGAVVWFVVGLLADRIFFYPPILFVIGIVAVIRGIARWAARATLTNRSRARTRKDAAEPGSRPPLPCVCTRSMSRSRPR